VCVCVCVCGVCVCVCVCVCACARARACVFFFNYAAAHGELSSDKALGGMLMPIFMRFFYLSGKMNGSRNRARYCELLHDPCKSGSLASFPTGNRKSLLHGSHDT